MIKLNGVEKAIFKQPITDDGTKNSTKGRVEVVKTTNDNLITLDSDTEVGLYNNAVNLLTPLFKDGKLLRETDLVEIRGRLNG